MYCCDKEYDEYDATHCHEDQSNHAQRRCEHLAICCDVRYKEYAGEERCRHVRAPEKANGKYCKIRAHCCDPTYAEFVDCGHAGVASRAHDPRLCRKKLRPGCLDETYEEYVESPDAHYHDQRYCVTKIVYGCPFWYYQEFKPDYTTPRGRLPRLCRRRHRFGCMDSAFLEYDADATFGDSSNADVLIRIWSGRTTEYGTTNDVFGTEVQNGRPRVCENRHIEGCTDPNYLEYDRSYTRDRVPSGCLTRHVDGCRDHGYHEYDAGATRHDPEACRTLKTGGCANEEDWNYDPLRDPASRHEDLCTEGCQDIGYAEFDGGATIAAPARCVNRVDRDVVHVWMNFLEHAAEWFYTFVVSENARGREDAEIIVTASAGMLVRGGSTNDFPRRCVLPRDVPTTLDVLSVFSVASDGAVYDATAAALGNTLTAAASGDTNDAAVAWLRTTQDVADRNGADITCERQHENMQEKINAHKSFLTRWLSGHACAVALEEDVKGYTVRVEQHEDLPLAPVVAFDTKWNAVVATAQTTPDMWCINRPEGQDCLDACRAAIERSPCKGVRPPPWRNMCVCGVINEDYVTYTAERVAVRRKVGTKQVVSDPDCVKRIMYAYAYATSGLGAAAWRRMMSASQDEDQLRLYTPYARERMIRGLAKWLEGLSIEDIAVVTIPPGFFDVGSASLVRKWAVRPGTADRPPPPTVPPPDPLRFV